jgi:hypothetical protein
MAHRFFIGVTSFGLLLQAIQIPAAGDVNSMLSNAEHLTLIGALIIGIVVMYRSNVAKDQLVLHNSEQVAAALVLATASNVELRKANEVLSAQVASLKDTIENWRHSIP